MQEIPLWYWLIVFFCLGACVGSFYNVIVYRMPRGISLINPPSHCPLCKKRIPIRYNLPIVGWLWLRGKSACCKQPISVIYPIGESLCGLLGALALYAAVGFGTDFSRPVLSPVVWADAAAMFWLLLGAYPVCAVDCKYKLIPDSISVGGIVAGLLISLVPGGVTPLQSLIGAVVAGGGLYLLGWIATKVLKKDAMGFGDVKLLAGYGALMGVTGAVETLLVAALLGIVVMVPYGVLAAKKSAQNKNSEEAGQIPFGPFLAIAAPVIYLWGSTLVEVYFKYVLG
ncbi:prepilin peptidase [Fibrobacter sp. UWB4]|uniref:prepilin peptidase n=1 Tax=Fibrobacter sp. UWB4 TaxID=1964356 RepID=UPI000B526F5C|nr:A24 family peptidase [Fibrobacter sp. UWB4]OWV18404.1 prepilin peptidase [Fibrobacter sp. UWB4]